MKNKTAMQQLLEQMREERSKLPLHIEWDRCYQAIEKLIESTYIPLEKEQIEDAFYQCGKDNFEHIKVINRSAKEYYEQTYGGNK